MTTESHETPQAGQTGTAPRRPIGQILKDMDQLTEGEIQEILLHQREHGGAFGKIAIEQGFCDEDAVLHALGTQSGMEVVDLDEMEIDEAIVDLIEASTANLYRIIPIRHDEDTGLVTVAMADPLNVSVLDDLHFLLGKDVVGAVSDPDAVGRAIEKYYAGKGESIEDLMGSLDDDDMIETVEEGDKMDLDELTRAANAKPVVKLLNLILLQAIKDQSSDVHFEPFESDFKVRYRVDGILYEMMPPPPHLAPALISRIKVMSNLDISETRLPQDGRIELNIGGKPIDLRVSTLPTMFGESVVMRILDRSVVSLDIDNIGLREEELQTIKKLVELPHGIIIVTGPTGSGKTTTLYSALNYANTIEDKIITTEDPVEYDLEGIMQIQIAPDIGVTYASCLRAILRQDPDIILVGEIRDVETAQIAIEASLTGHIVFSTLHTNDAPSAVTRIVDVGVEPFLVAATAEAIIAQRLVRRICEKCKVQYEPAEEELLELDLQPADVEGKRFCYGKGCTTCNNTGYKGRMAIFEIMIMSDKIKQMVIDGVSTGALREQARKEGMRTLRESGLLAIFDGSTTIEEVVRETLATV